MISDTILTRTGFESIHHFKDDSIGLEGLLAFTGKRPSIGGIRHIPGTPFDTALTVVCELTSAMSLKALAAGLNADGAKMFIFRGEKNVALLHAIGEFVESLGGRYIASIDSGTTPDDIAVVGEKTRYVSIGDPSFSTAEGVASAIFTYAKMQNMTLSSLRVFITGICGAVGSKLATILRNGGVSVCGKDITADAQKIAYVANIGATLLSHDEFPEVDVFAPCALGGILNQTSIPLLKKAGVKAVIGSANCQLNEIEKDACRLHEAGILYAPDYVVNRGGLLFVGEQFKLVENFQEKVWQTGEIIAEFFRVSIRTGQPTMHVAGNYLVYAAL